LVDVRVEVSKLEIGQTKGFFKPGGSVKRGNQAFALFGNGSDVAKKMGQMSPERKEWTMALTVEGDVGAERDRILEALERWKKWTIAAFAWLSLLIAIVVALIVELGAVKKVWDSVLAP